jgi:4-amino-4-deoxy-L-arabinose transferase-like glycosyltransferase
MENQRPERPTVLAVGHDRDALRTPFRLAMEFVCPLALLAILIDSTDRVGWTYYERDPSIYASIARYWQEGLIPYRDVWEFKPPLIFVALRAGFALWGYEAESLRRVLLILTALGALALYLGLRRARCFIAAPVAALGLMTLVVANPWGLPLQNTESVVVPFVALAIGCAAAHQGNPRWWWALLAGTCLGLATLGKQPAAVYSIPLGFQLCLWGAPEGWRARASYVVQRAVLGLSGFAIAVIAFVLYFATHAAATAFYSAVLVDGARYSGAFSTAWLRPATLNPSLPRRIPPLVTRFLTVRPTWPLIDAGQMWPFLAAIAALLPLTVLRRSRWMVIAWTWLFAASMTVLVGPAGENHYLVMTLPALALIVGIVCELAWPDSAASHNARPALRLLAGTAIAAVLYGGAWNHSYLPRRSESPGSNAIEEQARMVGEQIRAAARPGDRLFVEDEPLQIYLYAGVPPASRFIYWNAPNSDAIADRAAALQRKPAFVVLTLASARRMHDLRADATAVRGPLAEGYEEWLASPVGVVYRRRSPGE